MLNVAACLVGLLVSLILVSWSSRGGSRCRTRLADTSSAGEPAPALGVAPFALALAVVVVVSVIATLYPVRVATSITPLAAMNDH